MVPKPHNDEAYPVADDAGNTDEAKDRPSSSSGSDKSPPSYEDDREPVQPRSKVKADVQERAVSLIGRPKPRPVTVTFEQMSYFVDLKVKLAKDSGIGTDGPVTYANGFKVSPFDEVLSKRPKQHLIRKFIIKDITGNIQPGELCALMGPSGAGKSTLLDVFAGRKNVENVQGNVLFNGVPMDDDLRMFSAYVEQRDILMGTLTVREMLMYTAHMRLPRTLQVSQKERRVQEVIDQLGLTECADTIIGDDRTRGISGGQQKRVNIAIELITEPVLLYLDEPTSGLDSATAEDVIEVVKGICSRGTTVICTIHQPSTEVFALFDKLILLVDGRLVYQGSTKDVVPHFSEYGYVFEEGSNPAEFIVSITGQHLTKNMMVKGPRHGAGYFADEYVKSDMAKKRLQSTKNLQAARLASQTAHPHASAEMNPMWWNYNWLTRRAYRGASRDKTFVLKRVGQWIFIALVLLSVYADSGTDEQGVRNKQSLIFLSVLFFAIGSNGLIEPIFNERLLVTRERNAVTYQASAYYWSLLSIEWPFVLARAILWSLLIYWGVGFDPDAGKFFYFTLLIILMGDFGTAISSVWAWSMPTFEAAQAISSVAPLVLVMGAGFFIQFDEIPDYWIWLFYISPFTYAFNGLLINEFQDSTRYNYASPSCPGGVCDGNDVLVSLGVPDYLSRTVCVVVILAEIFVLHVIGYLILRYKKYGIQ
eukprot:Clim_evm62s243 gene=Clim_evmTU62s243